MMHNSYSTDPAAIEGDAICPTNLPILCYLLENKYTEYWNSYKVNSQYSKSCKLVWVV